MKIHTFLGREGLGNGFDHIGVTAEVCGMNCIIRVPAHYVCMCWVEETFDFSLQ